MTIKYLFLRDVVGAVLKTLKIKRADAEKLKFTFLYGFSMFLVLIISFMALIILPAHPVVGLLISFFISYHRDDGILKLGDMLRNRLEMLRLRIARLICSLVADVKSNRA